MPFGKCLESKRPFSKRRKLKISIVYCHCSNKAAVQEVDILQHDVLPDCCANQMESGCSANEFYFRLDAKQPSWPERWLWQSFKKKNSIAALITWEVRITRVQKLLILTSSFSSLQSCTNLPPSTLTETHLEVAKLQPSCGNFRTLYCLDLAILNCALQSKCPSHNVIKLHLSSLPPVSGPLEKISFPISEPPPFGEPLFQALKSNPFFFCPPSVEI